MGGHRGGVVMCVGGGAAGSRVTGPWVWALLSPLLCPGVLSLRPPALRSGKKMRPAN